MLWLQNFDGTPNLLRADEQREVAPLVAAAIISAIAGGAGATANSISAGKNAKKQEALTKQQLAMQESELDPFRHTMNQADALQSLDLMQLARYAPVSASAPPEMAGFVPKFSGGFSYTPSEEYLAGVGELKNSVLAGQTAPTMTNPSNYGRTGTLPILSRLAQTNPELLERYMAPRRPVGARSLTALPSARERMRGGPAGRV